MNSKKRRAAIKFLRKENSKFGANFVQIPRENWNNQQVGKNEKRIAVYRNRRFIVQVFQENTSLLRLSINKTMIDAKGQWIDGISWEELQRIKNETGFADRDAVEIFPAKNDEVNVANMRHLWVLPEKLGFGWRNTN